MLQADPIFLIGKHLVNKIRADNLVFRLVAEIARVVVIRRCVINNCYIHITQVKPDKDYVGGCECVCRCVCVLDFRLKQV